jgi:hypothetical protein
MKNKLSFILISFISLISISGFIVDRNLRAKSANRSSLFVSIDWKIKRAIRVDGEAPSSLTDEIINNYEPSYSSVFPDGLNYAKLNRDGYRLEESENKWISLFSKDRIISGSDSAPTFLKAGTKVER